MKYSKMRTFPLYFLALFILALFGFFVIGCDHVALLEYDNDDTYAEVDKGLLSTMAPPTPSDIGNALNILKNPASTQNADDFIKAISTITSTMNFKVDGISGVNMSFSINDFVDSLYEALRLNGIVLSKDMLKSIVIQSLNATIREVTEHPENRLDPDKAALFALGERLIQKGIVEITDDMADEKLLDTGSFVILSVGVNQAISASINGLNTGSLSYYVQQLFESNPEFIEVKEKSKGMSLSAIDLVDKGSKYLGLTVELTVYSSHQGIISVE